MSLSQSETSQYGRVFHTVLGGIDPGDPRFRFQVVGVVEISKDFLIRGEILSSPGAAGPRRCPEGKLSARWLYEPQRISNQEVGLGFPQRAGGVDPGHLRLRRRVVGVVEISKDF